MPLLDLPEHLLERFEVGPDCWEWTGTRMGPGYGTAYIRGRGSRPAHRFIYEASVGPVPDGLELDHVCGNHGCVNPDHLEPVTHKENMRRTRAAQTHCKYGHEFTPKNTYKSPQGWRICRACNAARQRALSAKRRNKD